MITKGSGIIRFYYTETDLWDKVQQHIGMVVKNLPDAEKLYPTADDLDFFKREMYKALVLAYDPIHKLSTGNINDVQVASYGGVTPATTYSVYVKDIYGHKETSLTIIDSYFESLIVSIFLKAWWLKCGLADQYKVSSEDIKAQAILLNNAFYSLYKPSFTPSAVWSSENVTVEVKDNEDGTTIITETTVSGDTNTITVNEKEFDYYDSYTEFPLVGVVDIVYVDRTTNIMYDWNGSEYGVYGGVAGEYSENYINTNTLTVVHNLGKMSPNVTRTDADGNISTPLYVPIDANSGTVTWNTVDSGVLRFN